MYICIYVSMKVVQMKPVQVTILANSAANGFHLNNTHRSSRIWTNKYLNGGSCYLVFLY